MRYSLTPQRRGPGLSLAALLLIFVFSSPLNATGTDAAGWQAGVASAKITPAEPIWLSGYGSRNRPSEGVDLDLFAKALALDDGAGGRLVIVTMDLIGVPRALRRDVEEAVAERYGLSAEQLLLNASHTHCGPELRIDGDFAAERGEGRAAVSRRYGMRLLSEVTGLVGEALAALAPANLEHSHARAGFAMNRRRLNPDGTYSIAANPDGPVDHEVPVLKVTAPGGELRAVLFGYACHNTTFGSRHYAINGDYAGFTQDYLEGSYPGSVAMFLAGCGGDQNPYPRGFVVPGQTELSLAQQHGQSLANAVHTALTSGLKPVRGPLRSALDYAVLDYRLSTPEELAARIEAASTPSAKRRLEELGEQIASGTAPKNYPWAVQVVQFGEDLTLVALGSEVVVDYALRIKRELAGQARIWTAAYSNDYAGYLGSRRVLREGGYEAAPSARPGPWDESVEDVLVEKVHELWRRVNP